MQQKRTRKKFVFVIAKLKRNKNLVRIFCCCALLIAKVSLLTTFLLCNVLVFLHFTIPCLEYFKYYTYPQYHWNHCYTYCTRSTINCLWCWKYTKLLRFLLWMLLLKNVILFCLWHSWSSWSVIFKKNWIEELCVAETIEGHGYSSTISMSFNFFYCPQLLYFNILILTIQWVPYCGSVTMPIPTYTKNCHLKI